MRRPACLTFAILFALSPFARADMCGDYRAAINAYIAATNTRAAIEEAREAARDGTRSARASRSAIRSLKKARTLEVVEAAGVADALEAADAAGTALGEALETVYDHIEEATAKLAVTNTATLEETRVEADDAAETALDSLSKFKSVARRTALKAASAAARTTPGATTSKALIAAHENIYRAACE